MSKKATSIVSYLTIIGWLIAYLAGDREGAKFYLNQSLIICLANIVLGIIAKVASGVLLNTVFSIASVVILVLWVIGIIHAIKQDDVPVPIIGNITILK